MGLEAGLNWGGHAIIYRRENGYAQEGALAKQTWAKQTGPWNRVKGAAAVATTVAIVLPALLAGCSSDHWYKSGKSPAETSADYKACNDRVEEAHLARAGQQRASYNPMLNAPPPNMPGTAPGGNLGENPMQMHDRVVAEKSFDKDLHDCMVDKGYTVGQPAP